MPPKIVRHNVAITLALRDAFNVLARQNGVTVAGLTSALIAGAVESGDLSDDLVARAAAHDEGDRIIPTEAARDRLGLRN